jgi:D-alanyl-D-alanine-carboxypeptidase/D-alanyl-D-alanine-endopeptidase
MKKTTLCFALGLLVNLCIAQQALPEDIVQSIEQRIDYGHTPSIVVGIIDKDGPRYYAFGNKTSGGEPVDEHSIYEIGSISKTFTGILLAQMAVDGQLKTDEAAQKFLPADLKLPTKDGKSITLGQLSDHTSGLPRLPSNMAPKDPSNPYADYTVEQLYEFLNGYTLTRDIGSEYDYSNLAAGLLGHILALKAGKTYEDVMINTLALPLGMNATKITLDANMKQNLAMGYSNGFQVSNWDLPTLAGAGAIRSSLHDMLRYVAANLGLQKSELYPAMQLAQQVRHDKAGNGTRVGLGWHIAKGTEGDVFMHNGGTGGYRSFSGFVKETGRGVVVLTNSDKGADDIGMRLLNSTAELMTIKKSGVAEIKKSLDTQGVDAALATYQNLKADKTTYEFDESALNILGYTYMGSDKLQEALAVFKITIDEFPDSFNAYDSYAEALMNDGQKELAITNYKKSLELNPANDNATDMLAKMGAGEPVKVVTVEERVLSTYVGVYELAPNFSIDITQAGTQLFGQATGQPKFELFAKSNTEFYLKVVAAKVVFSTKDGTVESLTLYQGGQEMLGKKMK